MKYISEGSLRKHVDESTIKILDLCKELSKTVLNKHLPVCLRSLRDNPVFKNIDCEFHTASPFPENRTVSLTIWT